MTEELERQKRKKGVLAPRRKGEIKTHKWLFKGKAIHGDDDPSLWFS